MLNLIASDAGNNSGDSAKKKSVELESRLTYLKEAAKGYEDFGEIERRDGPQQEIIPSHCH